MEDSVQQYIKAAEDLRELIREGHELLRDLRQETASTRNLIKKFEIDSAAKAEVRVKAAEEEIWEALKADILKNFKESLDKAVAIIDRSVDRHQAFFADQATTLALAMENSSPQAIRTVAEIARELQSEREKKLAQKQRRVKPKST